MIWLHWTFSKSSSCAWHLCSSNMPYIEKLHKTWGNCHWALACVTAIRQNRSFPQVTLWPQTLLQWSLFVTTVLVTQEIVIISNCPSLLRSPIAVKMQWLVSNFIVLTTRMSLYWVSLHQEITHANAALHAISRAAQKACLMLTTQTTCISNATCFIVHRPTHNPNEITCQHSMKSVMLYLFV